MGVVAVVAVAGGGKRYDTFNLKTHFKPNLNAHCVNLIGRYKVDRNSFKPFGFRYILRWFFEILAASP